MAFLKGVVLDLLSEISVFLPDTPDGPSSDGD